MKRKPRLSTVFILLLLLIGLGVMLYPTVNDMYYRWTVKKELEQYNQVAGGEKVDYSDLWAAAEDYNRQLAAEGGSFTMLEQSDMDYIAQFLNPLGTGMMGHIDIPSIDVHLPVYQGTEERVLQSGAGHWLGTSLPTGGESTHCVITAHNGLVKAKLFTDLDKVVEGDTFSLSILDRVLTYEVDQILVTDPNNFQPMEIVDGEDYVTLYTCYPYGVNTHRLLVRGHRVEALTDPSDGAQTTTNVPGGNHTVLWIAALIVVVGLVLIKVLYEKYRYRGKHEQPRQKKVN